MVRIFFESSTVKEFSSPRMAERFFNKWTEYYFNPKFPGENFMYKGVSGNVIGYLSGTDDSAKAQGFYENSNPCYSIFSHLFDSFPAHFHINVDAKARGQKVGSLLIQAYIDHLTHKNIPGVHVVTSPAAQNVDFYGQNQFSYREEKECNGVPLLFMGRSL
ncbi:MAG: GNAT family N-acetyltransferase [Bdellovibrionales bacterium]